MLSLEPVGVRLLRRDLLLQLVVGDDAALRRGRRERACPGCSRPLRSDVLRRDVEHAGLGGEHDPAVARLEPAAGPEAVAVEHRADHAAVGERDRGRAVPRFGQALVERVEAAQLVGHVGASAYASGTIIISACGSERPASTSSSSTLSNTAVSEPPGPDDREHLLDVVAEQVRGELRLARAHPVDVAAQRVDLAVVGDHPIRVRELPARERVRREARVHERERADDALVAQVDEVAPQLRRREHPLVDDRPRREARDHELGAGRVLGDATDHVQLALEGVLVEAVRGADEELADARREELRRLARQRADRPGRRASRAGAAPRPRRSPRAAPRARAAASRSAAGSRQRRRRLPGSGSGSSAEKSSCGMRIRIPAPSPVSASAPAAPRCSSRSSASSARLTTSCDGGAPRRATNATPHASCSNAGS